MTFSGYNAVNLDLLYIIAILLGILVIISKNPIVSVLFLIGLFLCISAYLILTGLNFIGLSYLLVYIGAVSILFLFILMLINIRISELLSETNNYIPLAILIVLLFYYIVGQVLPFNLVDGSLRTKLSNTFFEFYNSKKNSENFNVEDLNNTDLQQEIVYASSKTWDNSLVDVTHITSIGNIMYTSYSIWLIITSIILLLAMVGAIVITIKQK